MTTFSASDFVAVNSSFCNRGSPDFGEQKAWADCIAKHRPRFTDWGAYATMGRRFIIHR
jgi:hypothetical protein